MSVAHETYLDIIYLINEIPSKSLTYNSSQDMHL